MFTFILTDLPEKKMNNIVCHKSKKIDIQGYVVST